MSRLKRVALGLGAVLLGLASVCVVRALLLRPGATAGETADPFEIDAGATERLAAAIRFKTISFEDPAQFDAKEFEGLRAHLERSFPRVHATLEREVVAEHSLLYTWKGSDASLEPVLLMAHMDVVPVEPGTESKWTEPPFAGKVSGGFVWGRGTMDDKLAVLGLLEATESLLAKEFKPRRTVYLAFGHDEEVGGGRGATSIAALLGKRGVRLAAVLDEGSVVAAEIPGLPKPAALIAIAEKGYATVELTAKGDGGHSSMPPKQTTIGALAEAVRRLETNQMPARLHGPARGLFTGLAPEMGFGARLVFANLWLFDPLVARALSANPATNAMIRTTTAPTMFNAGIKDNVLASQARAVVNFRILPGDTRESVREHVRKTIADPRIEVTLAEGASDPSPVSPTDSPAYRAIERAARQVFPAAVVAPGLVVGATDSRHYASIASGVYRFVPIEAFQADIKRIHSTDERCSVEGYAKAVRFYAQVIRNLQ